MQAIEHPLLQMISIKQPDILPLSADWRKAVKIRVLLHQL